LHLRVLGLVVVGVVGLVVGGQRVPETPAKDVIKL
jgi:hypothetical protein